MSLISYNQRMKLEANLNHDIIRYYTENFGKFTFVEFLNFREHTRKKYTAMYATEKYPNRIPQYIWERYRGMSDTLFKLINREIEGGYQVFGKIYGHGGKNSTMKLEWQRDLIPEDPAFRQKLLSSMNYVQVWKKTKIIYSNGDYSGNPRPYYPYMNFSMENSGYFKFSIRIDEKNTMTGSEPAKTKKEMYAKVLEFMDQYNIHMLDVEEL